MNNRLFNSIARRRPVESPSFASSRRSAREFCAMISFDAFVITTGSGSESTINVKRSRCWARRSIVSRDSWSDPSREIMGPASMTRVVKSPSVRSASSPSMTMTPPGALANRRSVACNRRTSPSPSSSCARATGSAGSVPRTRGCGIGSAVQRPRDTKDLMLERGPPAAGANVSAESTSGWERSLTEIVTSGGGASYPRLTTETRLSCALSRRSMWPRSAPASSSTCASRKDAADAKSGASASAERRPAIERSPISVAPISPSRSRVLLLKPTSQLRILPL